MPVQIDDLGIITKGAPGSNPGLCGRCRVNPRPDNHGWCLDCRRAVKYEREYGISFEQYNKMLEAQNGVCAICKQPETKTNRGTVKSLAVDHCHNTGRVRGLLCMECNMLVGRLEERLKTAKMAIDYIDNIGPA